MKKILLVENDNAFAQNLKFHLEQKRYKVITASTGESAFELAASNLPDLVLSEINIGNINGFELCKKLRALHLTKKIPFVFLTAKFEPSDRELALTVGADNFLTKPLRIKLLMETVHSLIGKSSLINERILFISEDIEKSIDLKDFLEKHGYQILLSPFSHEIIEISKAYNPTGVLLDFVRESGTTDELILTFTQEYGPKHVPIIVLGVEQESSVFRKRMSDEANDYFAKPADFSTILASIELHLDKCRFNKYVDSAESPAAIGVIDKELINAIATRKELRKRKQKSILIIEDDIDLMNNLRLQLELNHYLVLSAENGEVGIELADINLPDLIISDIMLPGVSGYEVREQLNNKVITKNIPFLFLSAKVEYDDIRKGMELGSDDYLTKPIKIKSLLQIIKKRIGKEVLQIAQIQIPVEEVPQVISPANEETQVTPPIRNEKFNDLFKRTREIVPEENIVPSVDAPLEVENIVPPSNFDAFKVLFSENQEKADYLSFTHNGIMVIRVNLHRGVEKESAAFHLYILAVLQQKKHKYVIDLLNIEFIDASFLGVIVVFQKQVRQLGGKVKLVIKHELMMNNPIFFHGIGRLFEVYKDVMTAVNSD